jgi:hypothetical protein
MFTAFTLPQDYITDKANINTSTELYIIQLILEQLYGPTIWQNKDICLSTSTSQQNPIAIPIPMPILIASYQSQVSDVDTFFNRLLQSSTNPIPDLEEMRFLNTNIRCMDSLKKNTISLSVDFVQNLANVFNINREHAKIISSAFRKPGSYTDYLLDFEELRNKLYPHLEALSQPLAPHFDRLRAIYPIENLNRLGDIPTPGFTRLRDILYPQRIHSWPVPSAPLASFVPPEPSVVQELPPRSAFIPSAATSSPVVPITAFLSPALVSTSSPVIAATEPSTPPLIVRSLVGSDGRLASSLPSHEAEDPCIIHWRNTLHPEPKNTPKELSEPSTAFSVPPLMIPPTEQPFFSASTSVLPPPLPPSPSAMGNAADQILMSGPLMIYRSNVKDGVQLILTFPTQETRDFAIKFLHATFGLCVAPYGTDIAQNLYFQERDNKISLILYQLSSSLVRWDADLFPSSSICLDCRTDNEGQHLYNMLGFHAYPKLFKLSKNKKEIYFHPKKFPIKFPEEWTSLPRGDKNYVLDYNFQAMLSKP